MKKTRAKVELEVDAGKEGWLKELLETLESNSKLKIISLVIDKPTSRCGICGKKTHEGKKDNSLDCGGDCWGCVKEIEGVGQG